MLQNEVVDVKKLADVAENEPFEIPPILVCHIMKAPPLNFFACGQHPTKNLLNRKRYGLACPRMREQVVGLYDLA